MLAYGLLCIVVNLVIGTETEVLLGDKDIDAAVNSVVVFPCEPGHNWYSSGLQLEEDSFHTILQNGSLRIRVRMEDMEYVYQCKTEETLPDGTSRTTKFNYHINPLDPAFLARSVENVTLDWGTIYTFPCSFSGALPRNEFMILNGKIVTETKHNITEDSVVECRVTNLLGEEHDKAYITIRPRSKEWVLKDGVASGPHCQPYKQTLNRSSICLSYLRDVAESFGGSPYLIARYRIYDSDQTDMALANLFGVWDQLLLDKQFGPNPITTTPHGNISENLQLSFTSWRCVDWAKRLTCTLAYPRCHSLANFPLELKRPNQFYVEYPVCRQDCLAVTGLFCLAPLEATINTPALAPLLRGALSSEQEDEVTGWDQLLEAAQAQLRSLPSSLAQFREGRSDLNVIKICNQTPSIDVLNDCTKLPLDRQFSTPRSFQQTGYSIEDPVDRSTKQCVAGNGLNYRGTATNSACLAWDAVVGQRSVPDNGKSSTWPGLFALTPQSFPSNLDDEARSASVCRNPAGLAPYPFCLTLVSPNGSTSQDVTPTWRVALCTGIPQCSPTNASGPLNTGTVAPDAVATALLSATQIQIIVACVLVTCLLCFILIIYVVWRTNRCGIRSLSSSSLCLSALEFTDFGAGKGKSQADMETTADKQPRMCHRISDSLSEQMYVQHRLLWIKRRRKLRHLSGPFQCILGCWYVTVDCLTCKRRPEPHPDVVVVSPSGEQTIHPCDSPRPSTVDGRFKSHKPGHGWCPLLRRILTIKRHNDWKTNNHADSVKACSRIRRLGVPLQNGEDDEFEENTLGLQLHKPVAYVANATSSSSRKQSGTATLSQGPCVNCGTVEQLSCNLCNACQTRLAAVEAAGPASDPRSNQSQLCTSAELIPLTCGGQDPGYSLTESSLRVITSGPADLGWNVTLEKLFNMASMTHLLHPKLKQVCYPRNKLVELQRLAKRAFGWIILANAPNLHNLVRRHRLLSVTSAEQLGLGVASDRDNADQGSADSTSEEFAQNPLVVIKMLANDASLETEANFLREAEVLIELSHKNIVQLLGVCLPLKPLSLLLEYMPFGDLTTFLKHYEQSNGDSRIFPQHMTPTLLSAMNGEVISRTHTRGEMTRPTSADLRSMHKQTWLPPIKLTSLNLLEMALDACDAMVYLSDNYYVHRDVATRSFLVGNKMVVKLADFSMCRPVQPGVDYVAVQGVYLPVKWLPLESILEGLFQVDTDVWSFGVFLWELFTYASEPYPDLSHEQSTSSIYRLLVIAVMVLLVHLCFRCTVGRTVCLSAHVSESPYLHAFPDEISRVSIHSFEILGIQAKYQLNRTA
ncbi:hypothetical protein CRM22_003542 [Opisthorchis felineus]|uniref:Protein kinase domain-containing protein n=1 Tax=Opisthorchis felineus TaxID=147828 RepID=A0A4S2M0Q3_OPIFE|nr:hypothetical protein CRM22_003542 [Opisthorchis felineus]